MAVKKTDRDSIFEYIYRDAGNFKTYGALRLTGYASNAQARLRDCLEWGDQFVAEQVGVPALCREHWESVGEGPSDLDHAFHEFVCLRPAQPDDVGVPLRGALDALVRRMESAKGKWDVRRSPDCEL